MQHIFNCDNCDARIETGCFDIRDNHRTYYTPVVPDIEIKPGADGDEAWNTISAHLVLMAKSAMTTLCIACIKNNA